MESNPPPVDNKNNNNHLQKDRRPRILLGITGSVAAVKGPELALRMARDLAADVKVLLTRGAEKFWNNSKDYNPSIWNECNDLIQDPTGLIKLYYAKDEWSSWNVLGDPVLHIDLRDWADLAVVAPLSAHTLGKIANGLCDDTLSCCLRAWDFGHGSRPAKPLILAPAMNTAMWIHPLTSQQLATVKGFWKNNNDTINDNHEKKQLVVIVNPIEKQLACGEFGSGALATVQTILETMKPFLTPPLP